MLAAKGSVQELDCLTEQEKEIFLTAREIDQFELVRQASDRQKYICQGQSLNLFVDPESDAAYLFRLHLTAWKNGLKSLYYLKSSSLLAKKNVVPALLVTKSDCPWCEKLKKVLQSEGVTYEEITKKEAEEKGYWDPEWKTVPQMWLYKKHIGGYTEYVNLNQTPARVDYAECTSCEA
jgi:ribonucleoside-diphosphate reductase alpha chain